MKKSIKIIALIYVGVAAFTYALSLRVDRLEAQDEYQIQKESLLLLDHSLFYLFSLFSLKEIRINKERKGNTLWRR